MVTDSAEKSIHLDQFPVSGPARHPPCPVCNGPVARRESEKPNRWLRRLCCSPRCRNRYLALAMTRAGEHAPCAHCGAPVEQREGETRNRWLQRSTCSDDCARARSMQGAARAREKAANSRGGWPRFTGSELRGVCFAAYDVAAGDGGRLWALPEQTWVPSANPLGGR